MKENTTFIYALCDPVFFEVRYIGKADDPYRRYCKHLVDKSETHKAHWIQSLLIRGLLPIRQILEECDELIWEERERDWISFYRRIGASLTNETNGGEGGKPLPAGWHHTEETKRKMSIIKRGKPALNKGSKHTAETKIKMSERSARKGKPAWNRGKHWSIETCKKLSDSHKGQGLGRKLSAEVRKKLSDLGKIDWQKRKAKGAQ